MALRIIIIHGLNNKMEAFVPLKDALSERGLDCHLLCLPGHGENPREASNFEESAVIFDTQIKELITDGPYAVIAFSQGAMYLQMWLRNNSVRRPLAQILLAPALAIKNYFLVNTLTKFLPSSFVIKSQMPEKLRRFSSLTIRDYRILLDGVMNFHRETGEFEIPTLILVDPKDELVDARQLKTLYKENVIFLERPYLRGRRPGKYHIVFHPEYFSESDWQKFLVHIEKFLDLKREV